MGYGVQRCQVTTFRVFGKGILRKMSNLTIGENNVLSVVPWLLSMDHGLSTVFWVRRYGAVTEYRTYVVNDGSLSYDCGGRFSIIVRSTMRIFNQTTSRPFLLRRDYGVRDASTNINISLFVVLGDQCARLVNNGALGLDRRVKDSGQRHAGHHQQQLCGRVCQHLFVGIRICCCDGVYGVLVPSILRMVD